MNEFGGAVPILNVKDFAASLDYYVNKLGFKKEWDWGDPPHFGCVSRGKAQMFLCQYGQGQPGMWLSIFLEDVDALYEEYKQSGAVILEPPKNFPWGTREMLVEDPNGHRLRMGSESTGPADYAHLDNVRARNERPIMDIKPLPFSSNLEQYQKQAEELFRACKSGDTQIINWIQERSHLIKPPVAAISSDAFALSDAQLIVARWYHFDSWSKLAEYTEAVTREQSSVWQFESAVEAIIAGDESTLESLLRENSELIRARSMRAHRATLLIYVGANGVEGYRQKTPKNAVRIVEILLKAGAEVDAVGEMYGGSTTLGLVATSVHPFRAGVQNDLMDFLLDHGAAIDCAVAPDYTRGLLINACLANGRPEAAEYLAKRGAVLDLEGAAGVGLIDAVRSFFNEDGSLTANATKEQMETGFINACSYGRAEVAEFLLEKGVDIGANNGQTGLHLAAHSGHLEMVRMLLKRKAPLEVKNMFDGTVLGQALWSAYNQPRLNHLAIVETLIAAGAEIGDNQKWIDELRRRNRPAQYEKLAQDVLATYQSGDAGAMQRLNDYTGQQGTPDKLRSRLQKGLGKPPDADLSLDEARLFVAKVHGFENWEALTTGDVAPREPLQFSDVVQALEAGDYSHLEAMLDAHGLSLIDLLVANGEPKVPMEQAFTWACMLGRTAEAASLLNKGVDPLAGNNTGMNGFHYAAWHGHLDTVKLLIEWKVPLEVRNMYGGTVLGTALHGATNRPSAGHLAIIEALLAAGAKIDKTDYPTGNEPVDEVLRRHGAKNGDNNEHE